MRDVLDHLRRAKGGWVTLARLVESYDPPLRLPGLMKASERGRTETVRRAVRILAKRGYAELAYQRLKSGHVCLLHQPAGEPARLVARWLGEEAEREARRRGGLRALSGALATAARPGTGGRGSTLTGACLSVDPPRSVTPRGTALTATPSAALLG